MKRVAFLTASCMFKDHPDARADYWEHDLEFNALKPACAKFGLQLEARIWDSPDFDPALYDAVMVGTVWDYMEKPDAFSALLARCDQASLLLNPLSTLTWNMRKTYLKDLADRGAPMIPTVWADHATAETIEAAFDTLGAEDIVIKPVLGAGAWRQARVKRGDHLPEPDALPPAECMIQPFLPAVAEEGEYTFLFFNRSFSHCALKRPAAGDYRVQSEFGGSESVYQPSEDELALARSVLDHVEGDLLYARVDMLRGLDGKLALIELELIEPYLYPEQGANMGNVFAQALMNLIDGRAD
ncbi:ATP-grasp domain-containing protein [Maricaulis sp. D1M11]|uniref:ATP-grasp domain-containing protein n=1 Tax=Maricaulis sp. D1M11 TaxID=3076117 RepID=UPI0039B6A6BF